VLRAVTLSDDDVKREIEENWVSTWHNQCPGLYCSNTADSKNPIPYPPEQRATVKEGAGGGNVRLFLCDSEGRVLLSVRGFLPADRMLEELAFGEELVEMSEEMRSQASEGFVPVSKVRGEVLPAHRMRQIREMLRARDIAVVLREIEDNIYLKGAIG
jgi:hypothetical protein